MKVVSLIPILLLALWTSVSWCLPGGPPIRDEVCLQLWPAGHGPISGQQEGNGGFLVRTNLALNQQGTGFSYTAGETYSIVILGTTNTFRGFLVQARSLPGNMLIGTFIVEGQTQQTLDCDPMGVSMGATVAHRNPQRQDFTTMSLLWQAPQGADGDVNITLTLVVVFPTYYIARSAAEMLEEVPTQPPAPTPLPNTVTPPSIDPANYRLTFGSPDGCMQPNCTVFVGINNNSGDPNYLDFYVSGQTQVWVAVGFSQTRSMFNTDVLGCYLNASSGLVDVADTWNQLFPTRRNSLDSIQDTVLFNGTAENGSITCTFVRSIAGTTVGNEDANLNSSLFVILGQGNTIVDESAFFIHGTNRALSQIPTLSLQQFNVAVDTNEDVLVIVETPRDPEDFRLTFRTPAGCNVSECTVFIGIDTNNVTDAFLDVYMEGETEAWLAVGFSDTRNMFSADVLACNLNPDTGMVEVLDAWNEMANTRNNVVDRSQDVVVFNTSAADGRLNCSFARSVIGSNIVTEDLNLNGSYWAMYGRRPTNPVAGRLGVHNAGNPTLSAVRVNPVLDNDTAMVIGPIPVGVEEPQQAPINYRLTLRDPVGCDPSTCNLFVGIDDNSGNPDYLDFYIQGEAQGWVAVGFSDSRSMFDADVLGCTVDPDSGMVEVVDTWNLDPPNRGNIRDAIQDTFLFSGDLANGRITCSFTRLTSGSDLSDPVQDLDLSTDYYAMFGVRPADSSSGSLAPHALGAGNNPILTNRINPSLDQGEAEIDTQREQLIRAHGILMIIAWPLMAVTAIFFAAWMRPALPNGEWFQIHRFLMSGSIIVASIGFILIFVAYRNSSPIPGLITLGSNNMTGTVHYIFGIIVMFLHLLNPFVSLCRCKPDDNKRWIFNIIHGTFIGMVAELLALTNVGIGLSIFSRNLSRFQDLTILYVYLGYIGFFLALILVLFLLYTVIAYTSSENDRGKLAPSLVKPLVANPEGNTSKVNMGVELTVPGATSEPDLPKPKVASRDSPVRWLSLAIFLSVTLLFGVILIILVAVPE